MTDQRSAKRVGTRLIGVVAIAGLVVGFGWFVHTMMAHKADKSPRTVQTVQIIRPPPPPPDQPPPPPPPEKTAEVLPQDQPEPTPDTEPAPADQPLGVDAEGSAGGDAFGLAARRGGSDLLGGSGSAPYARYTNRLADAIRERLMSLTCAKSAKGSLAMHVTLAADGHIKQVQLVTTTGSRQIDQCIDSGLAALPPMNEPLPPGMPEQVQIKVVARI